MNGRANSLEAKILDGRDYLSRSKRKSTYQRESLISRITNKALKEEMDTRAIKVTMIIIVTKETKEEPRARTISRVKLKGTRGSDSLESGEKLNKREPMDRGNRRLRLRETNKASR